MSETPAATRADALAWVAGSDAPEKSVLNLGFMALTDAAPLIVAATQGFGQPHGLSLSLHRQPSWSSLRDRLIDGQLDAAQFLYGMVYGTHLGIGSPPREMAVLMGLSRNGQGITLSTRLRQAGVTSADALRRHVRQNSAPLTLAQSFPTGTHALWLNYWLAANQIHPQRDVRILVVPPAQMVAQLAAGSIDGFCAGEPWGAQAIAHGAGFTVATSQSIWPDHPEKVLGCTRRFVDECPNAARALVMTLIDAARFIEASEHNRRSTAALLASPDYLDVPAAVIEPRLLGRYEDGLGHAWLDRHPVVFFGEGDVGMPYRSDGLWFLTQLHRWGLLRDEPDYEGIVRQVQRTDIYQDAATAVGVAVPSATHRRSMLAGGEAWDGHDPYGYARGFALHALAGPR
ncbi:ABC transporter substrate-binding protein [Stutzerimonas urumqiensis]|uniref:CmpA/NrtA family ABC transporter substrate-binding protein n=1 Tax=Stutzerimonas urumqiensis TaxID=638269 RepID=UPI003BAB1CAC